MNENRGLIDTHAHIYVKEFDGDREAALRRAGDAGVDTILMPAIDSETHEAMLEVERLHPQCLSMMGLHPCSVKEDYQKELDLVARYFEERKFVAVGEIGLDFYWDKAFTEQQYAAFRWQIELALQHGLPIAIHSREATDECIAVVREYPGLRGVFHCFSGNEEQARQLMDIGFYLGIGGVVTFKNGGLDKVIGKVGLSQVILETDAPYLAPVPYRGKRNEPAYTALVGEKIGAILGMDPQEVGRITTENAKKLFKLN